MENKGTQETGQEHLAKVFEKQGLKYVPPNPNRDHVQVNVGEVELHCATPQSDVPKIGDTDEIAQHTEKASLEQNNAEINTEATPAPDQTAGVSIPDSPANREDSITYLPIDKIIRDSRQPRKDFGDLAELMTTIQEHGILQPIIASPAENGTYQIICGHRRHAAARELGLTAIPAVVRTLAEQERLEIQLIENLHRKDLNPIEEAEGYRRLAKESTVSDREIARRLGISHSSFNDAVSLLDLHPDIIASVRTSGHTSKSVLVEIAKEPDQEQQLSLYKKAQAETLTVKNVRELRSRGESSKARKPKTVRRHIETQLAVVTIEYRDGWNGQPDDEAVLRDALQQFEDKADAVRQAA